MYRFFLIYIGYRALMMFGLLITCFPFAQRDLYYLSFVQIFVSVKLSIKSLLF